MQLSARPLTTRDTLLLIAHASNGEIAGRTVMQKLAYFCGLELGIGFGHRPHYYGPYSSRVEDAVTNAVIAGELAEESSRIPDWRGGPELRKYTYKLEPAGRARAERLIEQYPDEWDHIRTAVEAIKKVLPTLDQQMLSSAAKTYLIISESEEGVEEEEIPRLAARLGWELTPTQVATTVSLLDRLGLLDTEAEDEPAPDGAPTSSGADGDP